MKGNAGGTQITGAGSSFDKPFFTKAFYEYSQKHSDVTVNYQPIGSGGGIKQFSAGLVDFGATDVPMNDKEAKTAEAFGGPVVTFPVALGAAAMGFNLEGVSSLKLSSRALSDIFLGKVKTWNDPEIASLNPGVKLPSQNITVAHRSDGSGTTYIFTDYLSSISPEWKSKVGKGKSVNWPVGVGGKGNDGVASVITKTPGAIGYVELAYVLQTKMTAAQVQNKDGKFVSPSLDSAKAAAGQFPNVSAQNFSIVNAAGADSYPITGYSWGLIYQKPKDAARAKAMVDLFKWLVTDAQGSVASSLSYAPLPDNVQTNATALLGKVQTS